MDDLDLTAVRAFVTTAELKSFTRAAEVLGTTQGAISTRLRKLEQQLGEQLLERTPRAVRLSSAGITFLAPAREMLAAQERALAVLAHPIQRLALGISHHLIGRNLPSLLGGLARDEKSVVLDLRVGLTQELFEFYDSGALDGVILLRHGESRRGGERLTVERFGWFAAPGFALSHGVPIPLATQAAPCSLRALAVGTLDEAGLAWREAFVGGGAATVGAAVEAGLGVAALACRVASPSWVDAGERFGLPLLPTRDVILYSRTSGAGSTYLRKLAEILRRANT